MDPNEPTANTDALYPALVQCFTVIICGYVAGRFNIISQTEAKGLNTFVGNFALPSLIFMSLAELNFAIVNWWFLLAMLIAKAIVFFSVIVVSLLVARPLNFGRAGLFAIFCTQSNDFAIGYPIIVAVYQQSHPEYAAYLYLMAPISLAILNPLAFVLMEVGKERESCLRPVTDADKPPKSNFRLALKVFNGIVTNPIVFMTSLGIIGNAIFHHNVPVFLSGILKVLGSAFSGTALFLLGLRMVGKVHQLRGPALILPFVLIIVKLLVLPIIMRETVSLLHAGSNASDTKELSTYGFLYGTFPAAPAVFVFATQYSIDIDLVASCMVACTFLSAPLMFISAHMSTITKDYAPQLITFGFDVSIVAAVASIWMITFFIVTKKYNRMPHRITFCLALSQLIMSIGIIWGGLMPKDSNPWLTVSHEAVKYYGIISCRLWTAMLAVVIVYLQSRGPCFILNLFPWICAVAWGIPALIVSMLIAIKGRTGSSMDDDNTINKIAVGILTICLCVSITSLVLYVRYRKRNARYLSLSADVADHVEENLPGNETTSLIENQATVSQTAPVTGSINNGCYGAITGSPTKNCCGGNNECGGANQNNPGTSRGVDIEDLVLPGKRNCLCPEDGEEHCNPTSNETCPYIEAVERAAGALGLSPPEQSSGRGGQLLRHTVLLITYTVSMFLGLGYTTWSLVLDEITGIFVELRFIDIILNYGQSLIFWAIFGLDTQELIVPLGKFWRRIWYGADVLTLTPVDQLSFETKHVCEQFITHHLEKCKEAIAKDTRWRMKTYRNVFRGSCLVRWLCGVGLARDSAEAITYGKHLLEGRLIAHINNAHHFHDSPLLYSFI
ncbi:integral membrane protein GPR155 homolog anchor [Arctopsyche grandis]|uniref:integral membrane protein GPR155 homolog anchor n=1 Tax=Arctopsyche grandis TaxID=121162 RepID=UPI00406D8A47